MNMDRHFMNSGGIHKRDVGIVLQILNLGKINADIIIFNPSFVLESANYAERS